MINLSQHNVHPECQSKDIIAEKRHITGDAGLNIGSKFWTDKWTRSVVNFNGKTSSFRQHAAGYSFYVG